MAKNKMWERCQPKGTQLYYVPRRMKVVRVVECTGLEIRCGVMRHRGFESHPPAKYKKDIRKGVLFYFVDSILKRNFYWGAKAGFVRVYNQPPLVNSSALLVTATGSMWVLTLSGCADV